MRILLISVCVMPILAIVSTIVQQALGAVILGTDILHSPTQDSASDSVWFYTKPANASVQPGDTYYTFLIVKSSAPGYAYVELSIDTTPTIITDISTGYNHNEWNISMTSTQCHNYDHGLYIAQMNITFDDITLKGMSTNLIAANRTMISIRYRYKLYGTDVDPSSATAFIDIKDIIVGELEEGGSGGNDNSHNDNRGGGNPTTGSTQEQSLGHMTTNGIVNDSAVSSSLSLRIVIKLLLICSFISSSFIYVV